MTTTESVVLLRKAIIELKQVEGVYHGHRRLFCPHILGTKKGVWKVFVWQFGGSSSKPNSLPEWRDWLVAELSDLTLRDGEWHHGWTQDLRDQKSVDLIDTVVDPAHAAQIRRTFR